MDIIVPVDIFVESSFSRTIDAGDDHQKRVQSVTLRKSGYIITAGASVEFPVDSRVTGRDLSRLNVYHLGITASLFTVGSVKWVRLTNNNRNHAVRIHADQVLTDGNRPTNQDQ